MTDNQFCALYTDALSSDDRDAFSSDWALSSMWGEGADLITTSGLCGRVWDLAHLSVADVRHHAGLSQSEFARRFCVPYHTVKNWEVRGGCAPYIILLLARACGMTEGVL